MAKKSRARRQANHLKQPESRNRKNSRNRRPKEYDNHSAEIVELNAHSNSTENSRSYRPPIKPLQPRNPAQKRFITAIRNHCVTFGTGPAGTGKSYCSVALAAEYLEAGKIDRIILTRPAVEAGEQLGYLPGALDDKFSVYIDAFRDILNERLGRGAVDYCVRHDRIVAAPLAYMRGKTFNEKTFVIMEEAQNSSTTQMKMFLTRIGEGCKVVINGDVQQSDIRARNGLADAVERVAGLPNIYIHEFEQSDIVRSGLVRQLIDRYEYC
jgi:phosphate starvation-inducible PhoH-like protein